MPRIYTSEDSLACFGFFGISRPTSYRVNKPGVFAGKWNARSLLRFMCLIMAVLFTLFLMLLVSFWSDRNAKCQEGFSALSADRSSYNNAYPLSQPRLTSKRITYRIAIITDLDQNSKAQDKANTWFSYLRYGQLTVSTDLKAVQIRWDNTTHRLQSGLAQGGRSMELSDLKVFDGHLLTVDDRTGVIYKVESEASVLPWVLLVDGPGNVTKPFKAEWMAVKDQILYIGGLGKEWTSTEGVFQNYNPMWIKLVSSTGHVTHQNWTNVYIDLRAAAGIHYPGYMIHESAQWSSVHRRWYFLPRRASKEMYSEQADEKRGTNYMLIADENFQHIEARKIGELQPTKGYSAFQFIPGTHDQLIVALKSEEDGGQIASYISVFRTKDGFPLLKDTRLQGDYKYEGIEFV